MKIIFLFFSTVVDRPIRIVCRNVEGVAAPVIRTREYVRNMYKGWTAEAQRTNKGKCIIRGVIESCLSYGKNIMILL